MYSYILQIEYIQYITHFHYVTKYKSGYSKDRIRYIGKFFFDQSYIPSNQITDMFKKIF